MSFYFSTNTLFLVFNVYIGLKTWKDILDLFRLIYCGIENKRLTTKSLMEHPENRENTKLQKV